MTLSQTPISKGSPMSIDLLAEWPTDRTFAVRNPYSGD
jgi:hypothetical protein